MSIKLKLIILAVFSLLATAAIGLVLFQNAITVGREIEKEGIISEVQNKIFERQILRDDYFLYHEERPIAQLKVASVALDQLLIQARAQGLIVDRLGENKKFIDAALSQIITSPSVGLEQSLVGQILIKSQENISIASQLADASRNQVTASQQKATFLVMIFIIGISLIIIFALYFIWRSFGEPLVVLKDAAVRLAALDFSTTTTTTTTTTTGELGELGRVFNQMVVKLKEAYTSLKNTNIAAQNVLEDLNIERLKVETVKAKDEAMLASIGDGVIATDENRKIIVINKAAEKMLGWKINEAMGKLHDDVVFLEDEKGTSSLLSKNNVKFPVAITVSPVIIDNKKIGTVEVFRDITREKEIDKAKSEFVSLASHQLRTPLGIAKWYLEVLQKEDYLQKAPQQTKEYFDEVFKNNERVLSLVRDLLSVSRIDQGRVKNAPKPVNIPEIITDIVTEMQILAKSKKVTLHLELKVQKLPSMYLDPLRFHEVVENLIANAIEYTPATGKVEVTVGTNNDTVTVRIQDTGMGISVGDRRKLFDKFFRSQEAVKNNPEGSGLGLYVVKSYVEEWGGKISVESVEGKGSTFLISLPITGTNQKDRVMNL